MVKLTIDHYIRKLIRAGVYEITWDHVRKALWHSDVADQTEADIILDGKNTRIRPYKKIYLTKEEHEKFFSTDDL